MLIRRATIKNFDWIKTAAQSENGASRMQAIISPILPPPRKERHVKKTASGQTKAGTKEAKTKTTCAVEIPMHCENCKYAPETGARHHRKHRVVEEFINAQPFVGVMSANSAESGAPGAEKFKGLDLKIGLEIHRQLDTKKLFCDCLSELAQDPSELNYEFKRYLKATQSEVGSTDAAALAEVQKKRAYIYKGSHQTCLVEADEEPPHDVNREALEVVLQISQLFNAKVADEIHFMRKIVVDGSNTAGFQRTGLVATGGHLEAGGRRIGVGSICLEEDAARKLEERTGAAGGEDALVYALDRLGIPLVEITTAPDIRTPEEAKDVAEKIGGVLRSTRITEGGGAERCGVKRGIGTVRQDVNVSIAGGARIEIKGFQELNSIPLVIYGEIARQMTLLKAASELKARGVSPNAIPKDASSASDLTQLLSGSKSNLLQKSLKAGSIILGAKLKGFGGLLGGATFAAGKNEIAKYAPIEKISEKRLGQEMSQYAKTRGVSGILHSDELPSYGITQAEVESIRAHLGCEKQDAFVLVAAHPSKAKSALSAALSRARAAIDGVPEEVRRAAEGDATEFMRPMPGAARMYPETDIPPYRAAKEKLDYIRAHLPKSMEERKSDLSKKHELSFETAETIISKDLEVEFIRGCELLSEHGIAVGAASPVVAKTLLNTVPELESETKKAILQTQIYDVFKLYGAGKVSKEGIPLVLGEMLKDNAPAEDALSKLGIATASSGEVESAIDEIVKKNAELVKSKGQAAVGPLMGDAMAKLRGKADGKIISSLLKKKIDEALKGA